MNLLDNLPDFVRMLLTLLLVVALMGGMAVFFRRFGLAGVAAIAPKGKRLQIVEKMQLDARRQMVLVARDGVEHLIILNPQGETVVETGIDHE